MMSNFEQDLTSLTERSHIPGSETSFHFLDNSHKNYFNKKGSTSK